MNDRPHLAQDDAYAFFHLFKGTMGTVIGMLIGRHSLLKDDGEFEEKVTSEVQALTDSMLMQGGDKITPYAQAYARGFVSAMLDQKYEMRARVRATIESVKDCTDPKEIINRAIDSVKKKL